MFSGSRNPQSTPSSDGPISSQNTRVGQYRRYQDTSTSVVPRKSDTVSNRRPSFSSSASTWPSLIESSTDLFFSRTLSPSDIRAINQATHDEFLVARNIAYIRLFSETNTLKWINSRLIAAMPEAYRAMGNPLRPGEQQDERPGSSLVSSASHSTTASGLTMPLFPDNIYTRLDHSRFSERIFWTKSMYREAIGKKANTTTTTTDDLGLDQDADSPEISKTLDYVQDFDGNPITKNMTRAIRKDIRGIFNQWDQRCKVLGVRRPATFMRRTAYQFRELLREMYARHPYLRLCDHHWKVEKIGINTYPSWNAGRKKEEKKRRAMETPEQAGPPEESERGIQQGMGVSTQRLVVDIYLYSSEVQKSKEQSGQNRQQEHK